MSTSVYAGLDLATRLSGWSVGAGEELPEVGHWSWEHVGQDIGYLVDLTDMSFNRTIVERGVTHLAYEAPIMVVRDRRGHGRNDDPWFLRKIHAVTGHVEWLCRRHGIWCREVDVAAVKRSLAGFSGAEKKDQVAAAQKVGLSLSPGAAKDDEADSFAVWLALIRDRDRRLGERWDRVLYGRRGALL